MSKLIATLVGTLFAAAAFAQTTPGQPPAQPAAGTTASSPMKKTDADKPMTDKKAARVAKSKARKEKRDAKVGDKPIN